jgi:hypothetical protein
VNESEYYKRLNFLSDCFSDAKTTAQSLFSGPIQLTPRDMLLHQDFLNSVQANRTAALIAESYKKYSKDPLHAYMRNLAPPSITPQQMKALDSKATFEFLANMLCIFLVTSVPTTSAVTMLTCTEMRNIHGFILILTY